MTHSSATGTGALQPARVMLLGDLNIDLGLDMHSFPSPGGDGVAHRQRLGFGGSAANTAVVLQKLGIQTAMLSCVGDDQWGDFAVGELAELGIDPANIQRSESHTTSLNVVAVTPDGERTMLAYRGASPEFSPEMLPLEVIRSAEHLHISGYALLTEPQRGAAYEAVRHARASGLTVSLDVPVDPVNAVPEILTEFMTLIDVAIIGSPEARQLTGEADDEAAARALERLGLGFVALKQGERGTVLLRAGDLVHVAAPVLPVVDTTGAGDSFCSGIIWAALNGVSDLETIGALANACGGAAVGSPGAGRDLPGPDGVLSALAVIPGLERLDLGFLRRSLLAA